MGLDCWNQTEPGAEFSSVIPGHREAMSPESITTIGGMDSGPAPSGATSDVQLHIGESLDSGFDALHRPGMTAVCKARALSVERPLSLLGPQARNAFLHPENSRSRHPRAGNFLDLAGGTRSIIDQYALTEPQIDNVLLARHLIGHCRSCRRGQPEAEKQQNQRMLTMRDHHHFRNGLPHLFWIFSPLGPTLIWRPSGCFL